MVPGGRLENSQIKLIPPSMKWVEPLLEAVLESQDELEHFLPWVSYALTIEATRNNMQQAIDRYEAYQGELRFLVVDKARGHFLGVIGLIIRDKVVPYFEIGYWLRTTEVGQGYMTQAVQILEAYAFERLEANRLEIRAALSNVRSRAIAERCGYRLEAVLHCESRLPSGELSDTAIYAKLSV